jgi:hypothetical protein
MAKSFLALLLLLTASQAQAATSLSCSAAYGTAQLNEIAFSGGGGTDQGEFIEIYFSSSVTTSGWTVCYGHSGTCVGIPDASYAAGTFWVVSLASSALNSNNGEVVLLDGSGQALDHLSWDNQGTCSSNVWNVPAACGDDPCLPNRNASDKDIARLPADGSGNWSDNDDAKTQGCSNSGCPPALSTPGSFNAVDVGQDAVNGVIHTKIAGQAFSLDLVALDSAGTATLPSYAGSMSVSLVDAGSSADCAGMAVLQSLGSYTFTGAGSGKDNGRRTISLSHADAAANVRVKMVDAGAGLTACSTDNFAIRPSTLAGIASAAGAVTATDTDWETAGSSRSLNNGGASGGTVHKAGRPFTLRAQAWSASGAATPGYGGSPTLALVSCMLPASGCVSGTLSAGTMGNSAGLVSTSTASYSEVGAISARLSDSSFAAVDAADGSSLAERTVQSDVFSVGRFVPDHFDLGSNSPAFTPGCGSYTYLGQPFGFGTAPLWTATARNAFGDVTLNYTAALFKLAAGGISGQAWSAASGSVAPVGTLPSPVVTDLGGGLASIAFDVGDPTGGGGLAFARASLAAPFSASLSLSASVADSEGVAYAGNPYVQSGIGFTAGNDSQVFGRLRIGNAYGSELLPLPVPLTAQYWSGSGFVTQTSDNCTALPAPALSFFAQTAENQLGSGETSASYVSPLVSGRANLALSAPGSGNYGFLDMTIAAPAWLQYNWDGTDQGGDGRLFDDDPRARAAFGRRNSAGKVIIRREIY